MEWDHPEPTITADGPLEFCDGDSVVLTSSAAESYLWSTGETTQSIVVTTSGNYRVNVTDDNGCSGLSEPLVITVRASRSSYHPRRSNRILRW